MCHRGTATDLYWEGYCRAVCTVMASNKQMERLIPMHDSGITLAVLGPSDGV